MNPSCPSAGHRSRSGNALVVAFGVIALAAALTMTGADRFSNRQKANQRGVMQSMALSALETTLARRESIVAQLAMSGDPAAFSNWSSNYGLDFVGKCEVRWKIEPVRTPVADGTNTAIPFVANPSPDLSWSPASGLLDAKGRNLLWQPNDYIYLFRVSAEARVPDDDIHGVKSLARAQGVRYVSVNNQPLFRWVIFYAAEGPKGDLELSHGSNLSILGNVHSNGSVYLGSAPNTNMWGALQPSIGFTEIGPYQDAWTAWASGTAYAIGARVSNATGKYRCVSPHTAAAATQPGSGASWGTVWIRQWTAWTTGATYAISDRVEAGGLKYKCTSPHTADATTEPAIGVQWKANWDVVSEARVTGADGIFRLSKQTMLGAINGLPLIGTAPTGFTTTWGAADSCYQATTTWPNTHVGEQVNAADPTGHYPVPSTGAGSLLEATFDGVVVNPNRVRNPSPDRATGRTGLATVVFGTGGGAAPTDDRISINGVPMVGVADASVTPNVPANDSRDAERADAWTTTSRAAPPVGFNQNVRNVQTGGKVVQLPRILQGRPLEVQALQYPTETWALGSLYKAQLLTIAGVHIVFHRGQYWRCLADHVSAATTEPGVGATYTTCWTPLPGEPHEYARPLFLQTDGSQTAAMPATGIIEVPGQYLRYALGSSGIYMRRRAATATQPMFSGWEAVDRTGTAVTALPEPVGLTIRERLVPDTSLYASTSEISVSAGEALPFAYGKQTRPTMWPFTPADVTSEAVIVQSTSQGNPGYPDSSGIVSIPTDRTVSTNPTYLLNRAWIHHNEQASSQGYASGGSVEVRAANNPGSNFPNGWTDYASGLNRRPYWYAENWRLIQLAQNKAVTEASAQTGLSATYFNDCYYDTRAITADYRWLGPFGGIPTTQRVEFTGGASITPGTAAAAPGCGNLYYSVRWEGFLRPGASDSYQFRTYANYGTRVWIDGKRVIDYWRDDTARTYSSTLGSSAVAMTADQNYPVTVEWYLKANQGATTSFLLEWKDSAGAWATVPGGNLRPKLDDAATRKVNVANWANFTAAEFKIDRLTGNALQKVGLMLRGGAGLSPLHDGRDPYAAILYSPTRGVFMQARGERSLTGKATGPTKFVGNATHGGSTVTSPSGEMDTEDKNANGFLDTGEDANGNGRLDDPATVTRVGRLIPFGPQNGALSAITNDPASDTYYKPSTAGAAVFGTSTGSGVTDVRYTNLTTINNPPFAVPEGTVDKVKTGPLTLTRYAVPRQRRRQSISRAWYWVLDPATVDTSTAYFIPTNATINDSGKSIRFFQRPIAGAGTGVLAANRDGDAQQVQVTTAGYPQAATPGVHFTQTLQSNTGWQTTSPTTFGGIIASYANTSPNFYATCFSRTWTQTEYSAYVPGTATAEVVTNVSDHTFYYNVSGLPDTIPKIYQGGSYVRDLTQAETKSYLEATYGGTWTAANSLASWATLPALVYPAASDPAVPAYQQGYPEVSSLRTAVATAVGPTTFAVFDAWNFRLGEYYLINGEWVKVTAVNAVDPNISNHTITVDRGQLGSTAVASHAVNSVLVSASPAELTVAIAAGAAGTSLDITVDTTAAIQVDDILRLPNSANANFELVRVTDILGPNSVRVTRGVLSTAAAHNTVPVRILRPITRTFRVDRSRTFTFDHNSFTSAHGSIDPAVGGAGNTGWYWTNQAQYRPWGTTMPASIVATTTGGFQPDQWYPAAAQTTPPASSGATTWPIAAVLPASGRATPSLGSTPGTVTNTATSSVVSPRWGDDQPATIPLCPPFGSAAVSLRLERSGNNLLFKWRDSDSAAWTTLKNASGNDVTLDVGQWFTPPTTVTVTNAAGTGTTINVPAANFPEFAVNDLVWITFGASSEIGLITAVTAATNRLTVTRGRLGTASLNINAANSATIRRLRPSYLGPDLQLSLCVQGGPAYWTTLTASTGSTTNGNAQTWTVTSTAGMQAGDLIQIGGNGSGQDVRERIRVVSVNSPTSVTVTRGVDGMDQCSGGGTCPGYSIGTMLSSLTNPTANATTLNASSIKVEILDTDGVTADVIDKDDWEAGLGGATAMSQYLASQYQVFWGPIDITEDFFTYNQASDATRLAREVWIYNPREFWSQSPKWDDGTEKDSDALADGGNNNGTTHDELFVRTALGKMTLLSINLRQVQDYLKLRTLDVAMSSQLGGGTTPIATPAGASSYTLKDHFNGLFYVVRTNRYPTNPLPGLPNPWNGLLPNTTSDMADLKTGNSNFYGASTSTPYQKLQPYALRHAPAIRTQTWPHGVRITNADSIDWGLAAGSSFGASKTSICTPNQLFIQGDLNTVTHAVSYQGGTPLKLTPTAVMGDTVTFLSNSWSDSLFQQHGLSVGAGPDYAINGGGTLAYNSPGGGTLPTATSTSYYASVLTHNLPTTRNAVRLGESAAFINTMLFLEDWVGTQMNFLGSLVVMDSRRHSEAYLLDSPKVYGRSPFGFFANTGDTTKNGLWRTVYGIAANEWGGQIPSVQGPPARNMDFNYDLLTEAGTPPFTPFGVTAAGVGAWSRIIE